jgi:hypothetical protein
MLHGKSAPATLILALVLAAHAWTGEPSGPITLAAPPACTANAPPAMNTAPLGAPPLLLSPAASEALAALPQRCGCGASTCIGKLTGASCGPSLICAPTARCTATPTSHCVCILPP